MTILIMNFLLVKYFAENMNTVITDNHKQVIPGLNLFGHVDLKSTSEGIIKRKGDDSIPIFINEIYSCMHSA